MNCNLVKKAKQRRKQKKNVTFRPVQINQRTLDVLDILTIINYIFHFIFFILFLLQSFRTMYRISLNNVPPLNSVPFFEKY